MFNVAPTNVAAPLVPVVVMVNAACLPLNVVQSVLVKYPFTEVVAAGILIVLVALLNGVLNVNADSLPLNIVKLALLRYPSIEVVAAGIDNVLSADKSPPPTRGDVVEMVLADVTGVNPSTPAIVFLLQSDVDAFQNNPSLFAGD